MLSDDLARHVALHETLGFKFRTQRLLLRNFVAFAELRGDRFVSTARVLAWAVEAPSPEQRRNRLLNVRRFAIAMHAEDSRHEVPAADALGRGLFRRKLPYIYSTDEIQRLMDAASSLPPAGPIRPLTYTMLFGLLATTGAVIRIEELLAVRQHDLDRPALVLARTTERVGQAIEKLQEYGISQMPVSEDADGDAVVGIVGSINEKGLLDRAFRDPSVVERTVGEVMDAPLPLMDASATLDDAFGLLSGGASALVAVRGERPAGVVTKLDLLEYLAHLPPRRD